MEIFQPHLVGRWVTSFMAYYPGEVPDAFAPAADSLSPWLKLLFRLRPPLEVTMLAPLIPANVATLSCFIFKDDGTFDGIKGRCTEHGYIEDRLRGTYTLKWRPALEVWGGDIVVRLDDELSITFKFIMVNADELQFVIAHANTVDEPAPPAAGTMRRVVDFANPTSPN